MTKASERLFETNYCAAVARRYPRHRLLWLSPTQAREAVLGYDTLLQQTHGIEVIQFKVPKKRLTRPRTAGGLPCLRIELPHSQVQALRKRAKATKYVRAHFVFPDALTISDYFEAGGDVLSFSYSLDAADLGGIGPSGRKDGVHLGDFRPNAKTIIVRSEPVEVAVRHSVEDIYEPHGEPITTDRRDLAELFADLALGAPGARVAIYQSSHDRADQ